MTKYYSFKTDRVCTKDVTIKGIHFRKGWDVVIPIFALHRDTELWDEPDGFIPER